MAPSILADPVPIVRDELGVLRVAGTRVTLDTVVHAYLEGASVEEIALRYESIPLADLHAIIAYYLTHRAESDEYLEGRRVLSETVRSEVEQRQGPGSIRQRLIARLAPGSAAPRNSSPTKISTGDWCEPSASAFPEPIWCGPSMWG